ncbi:MAG: DUF1282 family protein [Rhodocyclales bacterium]|nr:DUF1282 family protein [Rhodocyclales bacterium]
MNMTMIPKMLSSHDGGWAWLMEVHPSVVKMFALYVLPMSLIPPAMLLYGIDAYGNRMLGGSISPEQAGILAAIFLAAELIMVPLVAAVMQRLGDVVESRPEYHDVFAFAAVVPTPLWLSSLALFVPSLTFIALVTAAALFVSALLIYEGSCRTYRLDDEGKTRLLAGSILAAGLVAWVILMGITLVTWGFIMS